MKKVILAILLTTVLGFGAVQAAISLSTAQEMEYKEKAKDKKEKKAKRKEAKKKKKCTSAEKKKCKATCKSKAAA